MLEFTPPHSSDIVNVAARLSAVAQQVPDHIAVAVAGNHDAEGKRQYRQITYQELDRYSSHLADGLLAMGAKPGSRLVLMVPPSIDFVAFVYALFKAGLVCVLIDPGMDRRNLIRCLEEARPDGFIGIPIVHAIRVALKFRFPQARLNVTLGRRWFWGGTTLDQLKRRPTRDSFQLAATQPQDAAAIIFTTGSTGPPKGVLYRHGNFSRQADELAQFYGIGPGEVNVASFPLFALFDGALGSTTVIPDMNPTKPAEANPEYLVEAIEDWQANQAFGSPALLNVLGRHLESTGTQLNSIKRVLSAGAPVPPHVLKRMKDAIPEDGDIHTPYGATEALPVASIDASTVLRETAEKTHAGHGTCVGNHFPGIQWKVIEISDGPLPTLADVRELPAGQIGELMVSGDVVTREYVTRTDANALHKVAEGDRFWHRMGDVGYLDSQDRFWMCGRKSHRVITPTSTHFTVPCEAIANRHPHIYRSALVGVGERPQQEPVMVVEPWPDHRPPDADAEQTLIREVLELLGSFEHTRSLRTVLIHPSLPVDIRHNAKIFREKLADWVLKQRASGAVKGR